MRDGGLRPEPEQLGQGANLLGLYRGAGRRKAVGAFLFFRKCVDGRTSGFCLAGEVLPSMAVGALYVRGMRPSVHGGTVAFCLARTALVDCGGALYGGRMLLSVGGGRSVCD